MCISTNAIENISSKIFKHSKFEILLCWHLLKIFLEDVSLNLTTGHISDKNKAFIILQWQILSEQKSNFAISQCTNLAPHVFGVFQCGRVCLLILYRTAIFHFSVLKEEWDATSIAVGQLPQIPFLVLLILHADKSKRSEVMYTTISATLLWVRFPHGSIWKKPFQALIWLLPGGKHCQTEYR